MYRHPLTTSTVLLALLGMSLLAACGDKKQKKKAAPPPKGMLDLTEAAVKNAGLGFAVAGPRPMSQHFTATGDLRRDRHRIFKVVGRVNGVVKALAVRQGQQVSSGAHLATLQSRELADLKLQYITALQRAHLARLSAQREERLYKKKITTRDAHLKKKHALQQAALAQQNAARKLYVLGLDKAAIGKLARQRSAELSTYSLKAPFAGTVQSVAVTKGTAVKHDETILTLVNLTQVWGELRVPVYRISGLAKGQSVKITNRRLGLSGVAKVAYIASVVDRSTRSVLVRLSVPNPKGQWRPGCVLTAHFAPVGTTAPVVVPRTAVQTIGGKSVVFVVVSKTRFEARTVTLGQTTDRLAAISKGLRGGERVASVNTLTLKAEYLKLLE